MATIYTRVTLSNKTPKDLNWGYHDGVFAHVNNAQDIEAIEDYFGAVLKDEQFASFFVTINDGDYDTVYGCYRQFYIEDNTPLYLVEMVHES